MKSITLRNKRVSITAVHEAGHALAMYITRSAWGWDEPVSHITMHNERNAPVREYPGYRYEEGALTAGPGFTPAMLAVPGVTREDYGTIVEKCLAAGLELEGWARDFVLTKMAGPVAHWIYEGRVGEFTSMIHPEDSPGHDDYRQSLAYLKPLCGEELERFNKILSEEATRALTLVKHNRKAISALAVALPREGTMSGNEVVDILSANIMSSIEPSYGRSG